MSTRKVRDVMTTHVVAVQQGAGFKQIADVLSGFGVSAVPVIDAQMHVLGVVSEADLLHKLEYAGQEVRLRLVDRKRERTAKTKAAGETAAELMTQPPVTVGPDATIGEAARLLEHHQVKRLPVVDEQQRLVGLVSRRDLLRPYIRPDDAIEREVLEDVILRTLWLEPETIDVSVSAGRVTLRGKVDARSTAGIAGRLVAAVAGVVAVVNELTWSFDDTEHLRERYDFAPDVR